MKGFIKLASIAMGLLLSFCIFSCHGNGGNGKYMHLTQLTKDGLWKSSPRWSPDGEYITYFAGYDTTWTDLCIISHKGGKPKKVIRLDKIGALFLSLSPDGQEIFFNGGPIGKTYTPRMIYRTSLQEGSVPMVLFSSEGIILHLDLSPDGEKIAFAQTIKGNPDYLGGASSSSIGIEDSHIWVVDANGTNPKQLTYEKCLDGPPRWSPDGKRIAFARGCEDTTKNGIMVMNSDGSGISRLYQRGGSQLAWSPDGSKIAFVSWDLFIISVKQTEKPSLLIKRWPPYRPDTLSYHGVTRCDLDISSPDWSPDGKRIVFVGEKMDSKGDVFSDLYVIEVPDSLR